MDYRKRFYSKYLSIKENSADGSMLSGSPAQSNSIWDGYFKRHLPLDKDAVILEIGCGDGSFIDYLNSKGYCNCAGVDISEEQITEGVNRGVNGLVQVDLIQFLQEEVAGKYDMIIARDVLEHFKKQEIINVLDLIHACLKSNGRFLAQAPNGESLFAGRLVYGDFTHQTCFTQASLVQILKVSNFQKIRCFATGPVPHGVKSFLRYIAWKGIEWFSRVYMLIETGSTKGIFTENIIFVATKVESEASCHAC